MYLKCIYLDIIVFLVYCLLFTFVDLVVGQSGKLSHLSSWTKETKKQQNAEIVNLPLFWRFLCCVAGLCCLIAVSWYAYRVVQDFYDPFSGGMKWVSAKTQHKIHVSLIFAHELLWFMRLQIRAGGRPVPGMGRGLSEYTGRRFPVLRLQQGVTWEKERVKTNFYFDFALFYSSIYSPTSTVKILFILWIYSRQKVTIRNISVALSKQTNVFILLKPLLTEKHNLS